MTPEGSIAALSGGLSEAHQMDDLGADAERLDDTAYKAVLRGESAQTPRSWTPAVEIVAAVALLAFVRVFAVAARLAERNSS